jgi:hypothetical protein
MATRKIRALADEILALGERERQELAREVDAPTFWRQLAP